MNEVTLRVPHKDEESIFVNLSLELSKFNRSHENENDDFKSVLEARTKQATNTFQKTDENQLILFAEINGKVVGYLLANVHFPDPSYSNGTYLTGLLDEIFVLNYARGHKVGKTLMDSGIEWMKQKGAKRVKLHMYQWNANKAGIFYEREGFKTFAVSMMKEI